MELQRHSQQLHTSYYMYVNLQIVEVIKLVLNYTLNQPHVNIIFIVKGKPIRSSETYRNVSKSTKILNQNEYLILQF